MEYFSLGARNTAGKSSYEKAPERERDVGKEVQLTLFAFKVFRKFPRLLTIPCQ